MTYLTESARETSATGAAPACHGMPSANATPRAMSAAARGMEPSARSSPLTIFCMRALSFSPSLVASASPLVCFTAIWMIFVVQKREEEPMTAKRPILTQKMGSWE